MNRVVALNGTNIWPLKYGRLEHFFIPDTWVIFPYQPVWLPRYFSEVMDHVDQYIAPDEPYDLIGFSSGATLAHLVAAYDPRVRSLVAASGLAPKGDFPIRKECRVLMTCNTGELDSMHHARAELFTLYRRESVDVSIETITHDMWPAHRFGPAIPVIQRWFAYRFGYRLPFA